MTAFGSPVGKTRIEISQETVNQITEINNYLTEETINQITQVNNYLTEEKITQITNVTNFYTEVTEASGFVDPEASTISFDNGTRTFTIAPVDGSFVFYAFGTRFEKSEAESIQIDDVNGLWYFSYNSAGELVASQEIWDLSTQLPIGMVLWDNGTGTVDDSTTPAKPSKLLDIYVMAVSIPGVMTDGQTVLFHVTAGSEKVELAKNLPYSLIKCGVAPTAEAVFTITVNGVEKGTATIAAEQNSGSFAWNAKVTLSGGDIVKITGPATADSTLADVGITIQGVRK